MPESNKIHLFFSKKSAYKFALSFVVGFCFFIALPTANAQFSQNYFHLPYLSKQGADFRVINLKEAGLYVIHNSDEVHNGTDRITLIYGLDTALKVEWETQYILKKNEQLIATCGDGQIGFLVYQDMLGNYTLVEINKSLRSIKNMQFDLFKQFIITHYTAVGQKISLAGYQNGKPIVVLLDFFSGEKIVLPSINQLEDSFVADLQIVDQKGQKQIWVILENMHNNSRYYSINQYDLAGKQLRTFAFPISEQYSFSHFKASMWGQDSILVCGVYHLPKRKDVQGVFFGQVTDGQLQSLLFYDLGMLKNFFNFMPAHQGEKLKKNIAKKYEKDKRKHFWFDLTLHTPTLTKGQLILSGEAYTATYTRPNNAVGDAYLAQRGYMPYHTATNPHAFDRMGTNFNKPFLPMTADFDPNENNLRRAEKYRYSHAFAMGFDLEKNRLSWDNIFDFDNQESQVLMHPALLLSQDSVHTFYLIDRTGLHTLTQKYAQKDTALIVHKNYHLQNEQKSLLDFKNGGILPWYEQYLIWSGLGKIPRQEQKKSENFFMLEKVNK